MATVRRPILPEGPLAELVRELHALHLLAGEPSMRDIARRGRLLSYDTVHRVLTAERLPRWRSTELVVLALGGDVTKVQRLWLAARLARDDSTSDMI